MKRHLYQLQMALVLLVMLIGVPVAQSQTDENSASATGTGKITGRVVNESGQALANVTISLRAFASRGPGHSTTTDHEGSFVVKGLEPGAYLISAALSGYVTTPRDPDVNPTGYYRVGDTVRLELIKGGVITGTVTRPSGEPVVIVPVRAYMIRDGRGQPARYGAAIRERTTDDRGIYRFYGLPSGTYVVAAGGGRSSSYEVNAFGTDVPTYTPSSTRDTAAEIFVRAGEETANVDIQYRGEQGHAVSGIANSAIVTDQPVGFTITLSTTFNGVSQSSYSTWQPGGGRFSISGVADGDYEVIAQAYFPAAEWVISEPRRIKVKGADVTGVELTAKPLGSINGRVVLEESKVAECQGKRRPLFSETVVGAYHNEKEPSTGQPQFVWGLGGPTLPDQQGGFALRNLAPGQYRFSVRPEVKYWYLKSISWPSSQVAAKATPSNRPIDAARNWTTLKPGEHLSGLIVTFAAGAASLHGQIDLAEGQKLPPRLFVYLVPAEPEKADDILRYFPSLVLADGSFGLNNLPPGRYWVLARAAGENELNLLSKLRLPDEAEMRAKLRRDAEAVKTVTELKPCQNVTGYRVPVTSPGRQP
jgi:hypothetical protein